MSPLLVLALLAAPCPEAEGSELTPEQQVTLCALARRPDVQAATGPTREALDELYTRPAFLEAHSGQAGDLLKRLKAWLESVFETSGAETYSNLTRVLVLALAAFVVVATVARLAGRRLAKRTKSQTPERRELELADPSQHLARARALAPADARAAAREGLLAILAALERQRLARPDRVKTNRELARELPDRGASPELVAAVTTQLTWFDRAWYSLEPLDAARVNAFLDDVSALVLRVAAFGSGAPAR
ncbi:MAG: DUF4129 domain-containing protein [Myxococcales bacterium]|nr:DUF4129 domain-containing protein [Myxococcales bacterium]